MFNNAPLQASWAADSAVLRRERASKSGALQQFQYTISAS